MCILLCKGRGINILSEIVLFNCILFTELFLNIICVRFNIKLTYRNYMNGCLKLIVTLLILFLMQSSSYSQKKDIKLNSRFQAIFECISMRTEGLCQNQQNSFNFAIKLPRFDSLYNKAGAPDRKFFQLFIERSIFIFL